MNVRAICQGHFGLPMRVAAAVPLFTPEGERSWAGSSWDPIYAIPHAARDDSAPGTVSCAEAASSDETQVMVTYDVTSLSPEGAAFVDELKTGYDGFLESWRQEILAHLALATIADREILLIWTLGPTSSRRSPPSESEVTGGCTGFGWCMPTNSTSTRRRRRG